MINVGDTVKIKKKGPHKGRIGKVIWVNVISTELEVEVFDKNKNSYILELRDRDIEK
jgi:ribosomal protein L24